MGLDHRIAYSGTLESAAMKGFTLLVGVLALLLSAGCGSNSQSSGSTTVGPVAATVSDTIPVGTAPRGIAIDPTANKIYVANFGTVTSGHWPACQPTSSSVTVIDGATESTSIAAISFFGNHLPLDANVLAVATNSGSRAVYVIFQVPGPTLTNACFNSGVDHLVAISGAQPNAGFCVVCQFGGVAVNQVTDTIYLGNVLPNSHYISVFTPGSNFTNYVAVSLSSAPITLAVNPTTNKIYVALAVEIDVIDGATNSLTKVANLAAAGPNSLAVNPTTNTIYVADAQSNLTVIDGATGSVTATIAVGTSPSGVDVDPQTNFIYVANAGNTQMADPGSVTVIDGATNTVSTTLTDPKAMNPVAVAVNSATNKIYVANKGSNNVTVIDGAHH